MAVTVTDRRTLLDNANTLTGWTGGGFGLTTTDFAESTGAVANAFNIADGPIFFTTGAINLSNTLVYVYSFNNAIQGSWTTAPNALFLGDGTDQIAFEMAGQDRRVFSHSVGPTNWQCLVLDGSQAATMNTAGETTVVAGSFAGLGLTAITQVGAYFVTLSKALGGGYNCAVDIIRYGNDGIRITGGGSGTEGDFLEIAIEDRSTAADKAHGILRELTTNVYGVQGPLTFGNSGAATESRFIDSGVVVSFEDRNVSDDKYYFNVEGNSGATNVFQLSNSTIATGGPFVSINFASGNINTLTLNAVTFESLGNAITFSNSADASGHNVTNCTFTSCGQVDPGDVGFSGNTLASSTASATGALLLDGDGTSQWSDLHFISGGTGHAIYITTPGIYSFIDFTYAGYGATGTTNAAVYNNSGGAVTINVSGGDNPTYHNGASATTTVVNSVDYTVSGMVVGSELTIVRLSDEEALFHVESTASGSEIYSHDGTTTPVDVLVHHLDYVPVAISDTLGDSNQSLLVQQQLDRFYFNPV